jgi:hypothetical protein
MPVSCNEFAVQYLRQRMRSYLSPLLYVFYVLRPFRPSRFDHMSHYGCVSVVHTVRCSSSGVQLDYTQHEPVRDVAWYTRRQQGIGVLGKQSLIC